MADAINGESGTPCDRALDMDGGDQLASSPDPSQVEADNAFILALDDALTDVRQRSYEGKLTKPSRWRKMSMQPAGCDPREFERRALAFIVERDHAEDAPAMGSISAPPPLSVRMEDDPIGEGEPLPEPDVSDIAVIYGKKGAYLYSKALMSHSFAHALFLTSEDDDLAIFVDVVRSESRVYPRPVAASTFANPPYLWSDERTMRVFGEVSSDAAFADLKLVRASNGEPYFYSDRYLSDAQGRALAEWYGVEKGMNP
ncbi:MAG: hypothetical protein SOU51_02400 [Collinsella sp.]|nr:hypothetical protein [Collinsella sp.]